MKKRLSVLWLGGQYCNFEYKKSLRKTLKIDNLYIINWFVIILEKKVLMWLETFIYGQKNILFI